MKMLKHLFGKRDKELDVLQEEALQSPLRTVVLPKCQGLHLFAFVSV